MPVVIKGFKFRAYPTTEQETKLCALFAAVRRVWNIGVEMQARRWAARKTDPEVKLLSASRSATNGIAKPVNATLAVDPELAWVREQNSQIRNAKCGDLGEATKAFWQKLKGPRQRHRPRKMRRIERELGVWLPDGFPHFARVDGRQSFRIPSNTLRIRYAADERGVVWGYIRIPPVKDGPGELKFLRDRKPRGRALEATVSQDAGRFYVSITHEFDVAEPKHWHTGTSVGVDRNATDLCGLSEAADGTNLDVAGLIVPAVKDLPGVDRLEFQLRHQQRLLSKMCGSQKGEEKSQRWYRQRDKIKSLHARLTRIRADYLVQTAQSIASNVETVIIERLSVAKMTRSAKGTHDAPGKRVAQKRGVNRVFLKNAPAAFAEKLRQKAAEYGGRIIEVPAPYTSQDCPNCGHREPGNRKAERFKCLRCGHQGHASVIAASNILASGLNAKSSSSGGAPGVMRVETETSVPVATCSSADPSLVRESRKPKRKPRLGGAQRPQVSTLSCSLEVRDSGSEESTKFEELQEWSCREPDRVEA